MFWHVLQVQEVDTWLNKRGLSLDQKLRNEIEVLCLDISNWFYHSSWLSQCYHACCASTIPAVICCQLKRLYSGLFLWALGCATRWSRARDPHPEWASLKLKGQCECKSNRNRARTKWARPSCKSQAALSCNQVQWCCFNLQATERIALPFVKRAPPLGQVRGMIW
jgi:hypothetical protein